MSNHNQNLVSFFREAAPYIHMHRGKTFVIGLSGEALLHPTVDEVLSDIAILSTLGARIILVHGARPQIEKQLIQDNHHTEIHNGLRITDKKTLEISKAAIGAVRLEIENYLHQALNRPPVINTSLGVISGNFLTAKPFGVIDGIDHLYTGKVRKINYDRLNSLLEQGNIVLMSPLGYSPTGQIYNIRYEEIAGYLATHLKASKLIFLHTDDELSALPRHCNLEQLDRSLEDKANTTLNKISSTMHNGIERVHLINIESHGGLLLELYTRDGSSSMISTKLYDEPRQARTDDISGILELIKPLETMGTLAIRTREKLELDIDKFSVMERDGLIIGCVALYPAYGSDTAELSCLAIHPNYRSGARGVKLVDHIRNKATKIGLNSLYVLTTQSSDWFSERGFEESTLAELPQERRKTYNIDRRSKALKLTMR